MAKNVQTFSNFSPKKFIRWIWGIILGMILLGLVIIGIFSFQDLPSFEDLENPKYELASEVLYSNGEILGRYYTENRIPLSFEELNPNIVNALISTEDVRYYKHAGIDFKALGRVFVKNIILQQSSAGGGSTITQQLAKLLYTDGIAKSKFERGLQKIPEWITSVKLERSYTKEEIIAMYLNKYDFLFQSYGIAAAAENYFGKDQKDLSIDESAVLVGMLKNSVFYNPYNYPERMTSRRNTVLSMMNKRGHIDKTELDSLKLLELDMSQFKKKTQSDGPAPYFRSTLTFWLKDLLSKPEYAKPDGTTWDIYRDGLIIHTTIDEDYQKYLEQAVVNRMPDIQKSLFSRWRGMDPWTYRADSRVKWIRKKSLINRMRESERYIKQRTVRIGPEIEKINENYGFILTDRVMDRLLEEEKKRGYLAGLVSQEIITRKTADSLRKFLKSKDWSEWKKAYQRFQTAIDKEFKTKTKMNVFAYNAQMAKDTVMSPWDSIRYHRMFLQVGSMAQDPKTGYIRAWVGGINHKRFQFDHVKSDRQVGSTMKPFIYTTAIMRGISPCTKITDQAVTIAPGDGQFFIADEWTPKNSKGKYSGESMTLYKALSNSVNSISAFLMKDLGSAEPVRDLMDKLGIDKEAKRTDGEFRIPLQPSIALGAADLNVFEMTGAYSTFANNGKYIDPVFITRITDKNGNEVYRTIRNERQAIQKDYNYVMVNMLKRSVGGGAFGLKGNYGGKTGTTNDYVDGWFIGIHPDIVVGTWVGGEDPWIRFLELAQGQGATMARPIFKDFMKSLEENGSELFNIDATFYRPPGNLRININCEPTGYESDSETGELSPFETGFDDPESQN